MPLCTECYEYYHQDLDCECSADLTDPTDRICRSCFSFTCGHCDRKICPSCTKECYGCSSLFNPSACRFCDAETLTCLLDNHEIFCFRELGKVVYCLCKAYRYVCKDHNYKAYESYIECWICQETICNDCGGQCFNCDKKVCKNCSRAVEDSWMIKCEMDCTGNNSRFD